MSSLTATAHPDIAAADVILYIDTALVLPGGSGNYASTPDAASLDITGNIDIRARLTATDWTPAADRVIAAKWVATGGQRSWALLLRTTGVLRFSWTTDGLSGTITDSDSTVATGFVDGTQHWVRVTLTTASGQTRFYTSTDGVTWTQLGTTVTTGATSIFASTAVGEVGSRNAGTSDNFVGRIQQVQIRNGIDGTIVANPIFGQAGATSVVDSTGKTWTVNGTASIAQDLSGQPWHVYRNYPDGTSAELLGSPVYTSDGYATLWDTVLPLDTLIFYTASSAPPTVMLTSNTITVTGTGAGWLKDPAQPTNDIPFTTCPTGACPLDVDDDDTSVSFLRLGQAQFATASGTFPIIDAARSRTVAQTRKARESSLGILSHTLAAQERVEDILATGRNLFLQLASRYGWARRTWYSDYISVADVVEERPPVPNMTYPHRAWGLPFGLARPPFVPTELTAGNGIGVNGATYGDATATGRTYAQRTATGNTYLMSSRGENL